MEVHSEDKASNTEQQPNMKTEAKFSSLLVLSILLVLPTAFSAYASGGPSTIKVQSYPFGAAYDPVTGEVFVANNIAGTVSVISDKTNAVVANVTGFVNSPWGLAYDPARGVMFVSDQCAVPGLCSTVAEVDVISESSNSIVAKIPTGGGSMAYDSGKGELFVADGHWLRVISDSSYKVVANITMPYVNLNSVAYDSSHHEIFVSWASMVSVISDSTNAIIKNITLGVPFSGSPTYVTGLVYDSAKSEVFAAHFGALGSMVSVISDSPPYSVVANVTVGSGPYNLAYDSAKGLIFVANDGTYAQVGNTVSVISDSTNAVVGTVTVGQDPQGLAYDSGMGEVFVVNDGDNTVSVISDSSFASTSGGSSTTSATTTSSTSALSTSSSFASTTSTGSSSSGGGGGIPEFPFQAVSVGILVTVIAVAYVLVRTSSRPWRRSREAG